MPGISNFACNNCDFTLPSGWGRSVYAIGADGLRVLCPHPGEQFTVQKVTGFDQLKAMEMGLCGVHHDCLCCDCMGQIKLDLERDRRQCPSCLSSNVLSVEEMVGKNCPRCGIGVIEEEDTGWIS